MATTGGVFIVALLEYFNANAATIAWIPALRLGIVSCVSPVAGLLDDKYGPRVILFIGGLISTCGLFLSSFATNPMYLYFTDSVLTGVGHGLCLVPCMSILAQYFNKRFALVTGIATAGTSMGYFIYSPVCQIMIDYYGWRGTFLICSAVNANLCVCAALMRPINTIDEDKEEKTSQDLDTEIRQRNSGNCLVSFAKCSGFWLFYKYKIFIIFMAASTFGDLGYFTLVFLLVPIADDKNISKLLSAVLIPMIGITSFTSKILQGFISEKCCCPSPCILSIVRLIIAIAAFSVPWMNSFGFLMCSAAVLGFSIGVYYPVLYVTVKDIVTTQNYAVGIGFTYFFCGIGDMIGSPLGGKKKFTINK
ncbi:monocarboxylate transporter 12-like [Glandiceps talaboti]